MEITWKEQEKAMQNRIRMTVKETENRAKSCAVRAANEMRNSAMYILKGQRSGRRYKKPHTKSYYTASAPGEPPAVRPGMLRMSWSIRAEGDGRGNYTAGIYTDVPYAEGLDRGNRRVKPRPYEKAVIERAKPKIVEIFKTMSTERR